MAPPKIASVPSGYTQQFLQNPLHFMRTHAVSPPDASSWKGEFGIPTIPPPVPPRIMGAPPTPWQSATPSQLQPRTRWQSATPSQLNAPPQPQTPWQSATPSQLKTPPQPQTPWQSATPSKLKSGWQSAKPSDEVRETNQRKGFVPSTGEIERRKWAGGVRYARFSLNKRPWELGNTLSFDFLPEDQTRTGTWMPIYWLPWQPDKILETSIPPVPQSLAEWDDEDFPRFFFTAGISGCSVFIHGNPQGPTITHAGTQGSTGGKPGKFWRSQMTKTKSGFDSATLKSEVNAHMYAKCSVPAQNLAKQYAKFLTSDQKTFEMEVQSPVGCVFGIRYGRAWTMYLQRNAVMVKTRFYKENEVETRKVEDKKSTFVPGTDIKLTEEKSKAETVKRSVGPISLGTKERKVFSSTTMIALPLQVMEMYPNTHFTADLDDTFKTF